MFWSAATARVTGIPACDLLSARRSPEDGVISPPYGPCPGADAGRTTNAYG